MVSLPDHSYFNIALKKKKKEEERKSNLNRRQSKRNIRGNYYSVLGIRNVFPMLKNKIDNYYSYEYEAIFFNMILN